VVSTVDIDDFAHWPAETKRVPSSSLRGVDLGTWHLAFAATRFLTTTHGSEIYGPLSMRN
jgi:hypothetical protein